MHEQCHRKQHSKSPGPHARSGWNQHDPKPETSSLVSELQETIRAHLRQLRPGNSRKRLSKQERANAMQVLRNAHSRKWSIARQMNAPIRDLHPSILQVIRQWFELVDVDRSNTIDVSELATALQATGVPCDIGSLREMLRIMDLDGDGAIGWAEFEMYMKHEFDAGKNLLSGDYVLPSGQALPFGVMIARLQRNKVVSSVMGGNALRSQFASQFEYEEHLLSELKIIETAAREAELREMELEKVYASVLDGSADGHRVHRARSAEEEEDEEHRAVLESLRSIVLRADDHEDGSSVQPSNRSVSHGQSSASPDPQPVPRPPLKPYPPSSSPAPSQSRHVSIIMPDPSAPTRTSITPQPHCARPSSLLTLSGEASCEELEQLLVAPGQFVRPASPTKKRLSDGPAASTLFSLSQSFKEGSSSSGMGAGGVGPRAKSVTPGWAAPVLQTELVKRFRTSTSLTLGRQSVPSISRRSLAPSPLRSSTPALLPPRPATQQAEPRRKSMSSAPQEPPRCTSSPGPTPPHRPTALQPSASIKTAQHTAAQQRGTTPAFSNHASRLQAHMPPTSQSSSTSAAPRGSQASEAIERVRTPAPVKRMLLDDHMRAISPLRLPAI